MQFPDYDMELNSGNLTLLDFREDHVTRAAEPIEQIIVRIPRSTLARRMPLGSTVNQPIPVQGDAALLSGFVRELVRTGPSTLSPMAASIVREQLLDLTAVALAPLAGARPKLGAASHLVALRLRTAVDSQLTNPDADRASICTAAGVSERHANRILAEEGTSVVDLLRERRLEKCAGALRETCLPICDVASSFGYSDVANFARAFRARYGVTPRAFRQFGLDA